MGLFHSNTRIVLEDFNKYKKVDQNIDEIKDESNEIIVEMKYSGLTHWDYLIFKGGFNFFPFFRTKFPYYFGLNGSGIVKKVGKDVKEFKEGDVVFGVNRNGGTTSEYCLFHKDDLILKPNEISLEESSIIGLSGLCAIQSIQKSQMEKGQKVLIIGGGGNIGEILIQLSKLKGANVISISNRDNLKDLKSLGCDQVFDELIFDYEIDIENVDIIFDLKGNQKESIKILNNGGKYIQIGFNKPYKYKDWFTIGFKELKNQLFGLFSFKSNIFHTTKINKNDLNELNNLLKEGKIKLKKKKYFYNMDQMDLALNAIEMRETGYHIIKIK